MVEYPENPEKINHRLKSKVYICIYISQISMANASIRLQSADE